MDFLTSFISQTIVYATIYTMASLGVLIAGRTGIFNVSGEGVMLASASFGFITAYLSGSWLIGFLAGALMGMVFGLLFIFIHETFKINQFIIGISLVILGTGLSDFLYKIIIGVRLSAPQAPPVPRITIPLISKIPIISALFNQDIIVYVMYVVVIVSYWFFALLGGFLFAAVEVIAFKLQLLSTNIPYQFFLMLPFFFRNNNYDDLQETY